jgi:DNA polymerase-1
VLKQAFRDGLDIHAMTASEMFGVPIKDMPAEVRRRAKAINFGIIYGISAFGLANQLGIAREEASAYIKKYFERFPGIRAYMDETRDFCRSNGYVTTLFGRKMAYPTSRPPTHRSAPSTSAPRSMRGCRAPPPTSSAAPWCGWKTRWREEALGADAAAGARRTDLRGARRRGGGDPAVVQHVMQDAPFPAVLLSLPLQVDARAANNWDEAH